MIRRVIDNLRPSRPHRFIFICQAEHVARFDLEDQLEAWAPDCEIVRLDGVTEGAACSILAARDLFDSGPLMIANSDQYIEEDIDAYLAAAGPEDDGLIMTMTATDPKWSFVGFGPDQKVQRVVEKQAISNEATVGIYNFASSRLFTESADLMISQNLRVNGEFYVAPAYNQLISQGSNIAIHNIGKEYDGMWGLGTPNDLNRFLEFGPSLT